MNAADLIACHVDMHDSVQSISVFLAWRSCLVLTSWREMFASGARKQVRFETKLLE